MSVLREYIRHLLWEVSDSLWKSSVNADDTDDEDKPDNLLLEPDIAMDPQKEKDEQSVAANIAGVTTPLGTGPTYPAKSRRKKKKSVVQAVGGAFGGARPIKDEDA